MNYNINILDLIVIFLIHWIADFLLQSEKMANGKSKDNYQLFLHVITYTMCWFLICIPFINITQLSIFCLITFIYHFITDYFTSRWTSSLYKQKRYRAFFKVIGFDQFLHYTQLILTYIFIKSL